jgi:hypothetical protein
MIGDEKFEGNGCFQLRYCIGICLQGLRKTKEGLRIADVPSGM